MKARHERHMSVASPALSPPKLAVETPCGVTDRLRVLRAMRSLLEAEIVADRLYWRIHLSELLAVYQEIEDCCVTQAIAPHQRAAPQEALTDRKRDIARGRAEATAA
jgi:hypothetical protein